MAAKADVVLHLALWDRIVLVADTGEISEAQYGIGDLSRGLADHHAFFHVSATSRKGACIGNGLHAT